MTADHPVYQRVDLRGLVLPEGRTCPWHTRPGGDENNHLYLGPKARDADLTPGREAQSYLRRLDARRLFDERPHERAATRGSSTSIAPRRETRSVLDLQGHNRLSGRRRLRRWPTQVLGKPTTTADSDIYLWDTREGRMTHLTPHKASTQYQASEFDPDLKWLYYLTNSVVSSPASVATSWRRANMRTSSRPTGTSSSRSSRATAATASRPSTMTDGLLSASTTRRRDAWYRCPSYPTAT